MSKQIVLDQFLASTNNKIEEDVHFRVPFLPLTAPQSPTPAAFVSTVPLYPHQERSLYRMLQIESRDEDVCKFNFGMLDYISRGGCLADAIGTGKTATMLALIVSEPINATLGGNLLIAPSHLLAQWKLEVQKFIKPGELDVVIGIRRYLSLDPATISNRTLILISVEEVLESKSYFYSFRKIYPREVGKFGKPLLIDLETLETYTNAAKHVNQAYSGPLWVSSLHFPTKPWRRLIFEEVQDLVLPGKTSQDCFIQLTYRCQHVWLVTATPFPAKAESIYANNQLLGFKRLRLRPHDPVFDEIKRKLYLRNCAQVQQQAITNRIQVEHHYVTVPLHPYEQLLYKIEQVLAVGRFKYDWNEEETKTMQVLPTSYWNEIYKCARQSCVHVGISDRVLERDQSARRSVTTDSLISVKRPDEVWKREEYFLDRQVAIIHREFQEMEQLENATRNTIDICKVLLNQVYWTIADCFQDMRTSQLDQYFDPVSLETKRGFRILTRHGKWINQTPPEPTDLILYNQDEIEHYLRKYWDSHTALTRFQNIMETTYRERCPKARSMAQEQLNQLNECLQLRKETQTSHSHQTMAKVPTHGSKITHLIQYLQRLFFSQSSTCVVLFTMWDKALRVVEQALRMNGITCGVFLQHQSSETKSAHVLSFLQGETQVLLLNALTSASGINLQLASHVIFFDPVGYSPMQASTLEQQAIGRVVRMGQLNSHVTVVRFVAEQTMEVSLYDEIHAMSQRLASQEESFFDGNNKDAYVCLDYAEPIRKVVRMEIHPDQRPISTTEVDQEIAMVGAMSLEQVINQRVQVADAQGYVVDLTEEGNELPPTATIMNGVADESARGRRKRRRPEMSQSVQDSTNSNTVMVKNEPIKQELIDICS